MFIDESKLNGSVFKHLLIGVPREEDKPRENLENVRVFLRPYEDIRMSVEVLANSCNGKIWVNMTKLI